MSISYRQYKGVLFLRKLASLDTARNEIEPVAKPPAFSDQELPQAYTDMETKPKLTYAQFRQQQEEPKPIEQPSAVKVEETVPEIATPEEEQA